MILKSFEIEKIDIKKYNYFLFYGENSVFKKEIIEKKFKPEFKNNTFTYDESEILKDEKSFSIKYYLAHFLKNKNSY